MPRSGWVVGMPSLTARRATARAALLTVDAMEVDLDLDRGPRSSFAHDDPVHLPGARARRRSSTCARASCTRCRSTGTRLDAASLVDGRHHAHRPRRGQRPRGRGDDGLQPRRAGPAPQHRPGRRRGLRLRPPLPRRGPDRVRVLRPARTSRRPTRSPSPRRRRGRCSATVPREVGAGAHRARADAAAGDVLRHGVRRAVGVRARRARRHPAGGPRPALARRTSRPRPSTCSTSRAPASTSTTGCSASATRSASTTRSSCPSSTPARWRTPAA